MDTLKNADMATAYLQILVSYNNLSNTLTTYIKKQCAYLTTWPIHYVSIDKDLLSLHFLIFKRASKFVSALSKRCALAVPSCKMLEVVYMDVRVQNFLV